jgi:hypothetical protein
MPGRSLLHAVLSWQVAEDKSPPRCSWGSAHGHEWALTPRTRSAGSDTLQATIDETDRPRRDRPKRLTRLEPQGDGQRGSQSDDDSPTWRGNPEVMPR